MKWEKRAADDAIIPFLLQRRHMLHHDEFDTEAKQMRSVIRVLLSWMCGAWRLHAKRETCLDSFP